MIKSLMIRSCNIGDGTTKIIVPLVGKNKLELETELHLLESAKYDLIEWRADFVETILNKDEAITLGTMIRQKIGNKPLLFTFRTANEGGLQDISTWQYQQLCDVMIESGLIDLLDVEINYDDNVLEKLISKAHEYAISIIGSYHNFSSTPPNNELHQQFDKMNQFKADIFKLAVMPNSTEDVLSLLNFTFEMKQAYPNNPLITMSMGKLGAITRISGELFGSAISFASLNKASAPGQLNINDLNFIYSCLK